MEELPKVNSVRAIIDLFEENCKSETAQRLNKSLSKSFSGLSFSERKSKSYVTSGHDIFYNLEQKLQTISFKLYQYRVYEKDTHIALQEELVEIMTTLLNTDIKNNALLFKMRELLGDIKARFKDLNSRLPGSSGNIRQGFGDFTYRPFSSKRPNLIGGAIMESMKSPNNSKELECSSFQRKKDPQRTQSVVEEYVNSLERDSYNRELETSNRWQDDKESEEALISPSSFKRSPDFIIGGAIGTRRPVNPEDINILKNRTGDNVQLRSRIFHRSASEVAAVETLEKPVITSWRDSSKPWSYGDQLRGRRRPVSLGGTVVTLNSPEDIISSSRLPHDSPQSPNGFLVHQDNKEEGTEVVERIRNSEDDGLQSVNLLKRFFELKLVEREKRQHQKSFNAKEDQREGFKEYVESIEKSIQANSEQEPNTSSSLPEENADDSSNETVIELDGEAKQYVSKSTSVEVDETEGLNTPVLRNGEVDEVVITSFHDEIEEADSFCSEQSIYLDPVD